MASTASVFKLIARDASRAARLAAAASRPARSSGSVSTCRRCHRRSSTCSSSSSCSDDDDAYYSDSDDDHSSDDTSDPEPGKDVTERDVESDEAVRALYELWCKAYNKERDLPEMARRFNRFKRSAKMVLEWNDADKNDQVTLGIFADGRDEADGCVCHGDWATCRCR